MKRTILVLIIILFAHPLAFARDITSDRAIEKFFKEQTELRIASDAIEAYKVTFNQTSLKVIQRAVELVKEDNRKTILKRDIDQASQEVLRRAPMTVGELMEKIKLLSIIDFLVKSRHFV